MPRLGSWLVKNFVALNVVLVENFLIQTMHGLRILWKITVRRLKLWDEKNILVVQNIWPSLIVEGKPVDE